MKKYIDADSLKAEFTGNFACEYPAPLVKALIDNHPAADVVEVVRCKDCKHLMFSDCYGECSQSHMGIVRPNDFCNYGEKIEKNEVDINET